MSMIKSECSHKMLFASDFTAEEMLTQVKIVIFDNRTVPCYLQFMHQWFHTTNSQFVPILERSNNWYHV